MQEICVSWLHMLSVERLRDTISAVYQNTTPERLTVVRAVLHDPRSRIDDDLMTVWTKATSVHPFDVYSSLIVRGWVWFDNHDRLEMVRTD